MKQPYTRMYSRKQGMDVECNALALSLVKLYGRIETEVPEEKQAEETGGRIKKKFGFVGSETFFEDGGLLNYRYVWCKVSLCT